MTINHFVSVLVVLLLPSCLGQGAIQTFPALKVSSPFLVEHVNQLNECIVPSSLSSALSNSGFTKLACPFGVVLAVTSAYSDSWLQYSANVVANMLDQDEDGQVDDPVVLTLITDYGSGGGGGLFCGINEEEESRLDNVSKLHGLVSFGCQTWKGVGDADEGGTFKAILQEEIFHLIHNIGYAVAYPQQFGIEDFTASVIAQEMSRLQCVQPGWWHPENLCPNDSPRSPGNPANSPLPPNPSEGDCTEASCDISEFFKQAIWLLIGASSSDDPSNLPAWFSDYMPTTRAAAEAMLSNEFLSTVRNPIYHQLTSPLSGTYTANPTPANPTMSPQNAPTLIPTSNPQEQPTPNAAPTPLTRPCNCEVLGSRFCNFDNGDSGSCEDCPEAPSSNCDSIGLPTHGAMSCKNWCFTSSSTPSPTPLLTLVSTSALTPSPTLSPISAPPTPLLTLSPAVAPTTSPTLSPTSSPTISPTLSPTLPPTLSPTLAPTSLPTPFPTLSPTSSPTPFLTLSPTSSPAPSPTLPPTLSLTLSPTSAPTPSLTLSPTSAPPGPLCFSGKSTVEVNDRGLVALTEVKIGDLVKADNGFSHVYSFGHRNCEKLATYLQIYIKDYKQPLEISANHMVFTTKKAPVAASTLKVGDTLLLDNERQGAIRVIREVNRRGVYAPFTMSGKIVVSNVVASSYVALAESPRFVNNHWLAHRFQALNRLAFMSGRVETYDDDGLSNWVAVPLSASQWCLRQNDVVKTVVFVPTFIFFLLLLAVVEWLFTRRCLATTIPLVVSFFVFRRFKWRHKASK